MKKAIFLTGFLGVMALTSCVSLSEHENLQAKYDQTAKQYRLTLQERDELRENNANLTKTNNALTSDYSELSAAKQNAMKQWKACRAALSRCVTITTLPWRITHSKWLAKTATLCVRKTSSPRAPKN